VSIPALIFQRPARGVYLEPSKVVGVARILYICNIAALMKAFALTNFIELVLWLMFLFVPNLRRSFVAAFSVRSVQLIFLFWAWVAIACFWGDALFLERLDEVASWRKLLLVPMAIALFDCRRLRTLVYGVFVAAATVFLLVSYGIHFELLNLGPLEAREVLENHSTQGSVFAVAGLVCAVAVWVLVQARKFKAAVLVCILGLAFWLNIVLIGSGRTPLIALVMFACAAPFILLCRTRALVVVGLVVLLFATVISSPLGDTARSRVSQAYLEYSSAKLVTGEQSSSVGMRVQMWIITSEVIKTSAILGSGSGSFSNRFAEKAANYGDWIAKKSDDPHNQYLLLWAEHGLIGLGLFLMAIGSVLFKGVLMRSHLDDSISEREVATLILVVAYFLVSSLANGHFGSFVEGRICWIVIAFILAILPGNEYQLGSK